MKKRLLSVVLLALIISLLLPVAAFAAETTEDGLLVRQTTDKTAYGDKDYITTKLTVTNTNSGMVAQNVRLRNNAPVGYYLVSGYVSEQNVGNLKSGETVTLTSKFYPSSNPLTGDDSAGKLFLYAGLALVSAAALVWMLRSKKLRRYISMFLVCCSLVGLVSFVGAEGAFADAAKPKQISLSTVVNVGLGQRTVYSAVLYDGLAPEKRPVTGVTLNISELTLTVGDPDGKLTATVLPDNATDKNVTWSSSNTDVATVDTEGNVHAVAPGNATITVTTEDGSKTATCAVTVENPIVPVTGVTLNIIELTLTVGDSDRKLTATVLPDNATNKNVTWSSSNTDVATVDTEGNVHAVAPGNATITVTTEDGSKTATCEVTVNETYTVTFEMLGHGTSIDKLTNVTSGSKITAPTAPTAEGFTFGGWYKEPLCQNEWKFDTDTVTNDTTLYAKWTEAKTTIAEILATVSFPTTDNRSNPPR